MTQVVDNIKIEMSDIEEQQLVEVEYLLEDLRDPIDSMFYYISSEAEYDLETLEGYIRDLNNVIRNARELRTKLKEITLPYSIMAVQ
jgi:hypothetical protein